MWLAGAVVPAQAAGQLLFRSSLWLESRAHLSFRDELLVILPLRGMFQVLTLGWGCLLPRTIPGIIALATWRATPLSLAPGPWVPLISPPGLSLSSPDGHHRRVNTPFCSLPR